jgi:hypothetical protein
MSRIGGYNLPALCNVLPSAFFVYIKPAQVAYSINNAKGGAPRRRFDELIISNF